MVALQAGAEDLGDPVGGQSPQAKLTASLEQAIAVDSGKFVAGVQQVS